LQYDFLSQTLEIRKMSIAKSTLLVSFARVKQVKSNNNLHGCHINKRIDAIIKNGF